MSIWGKRVDAAVNGASKRTKVLAVACVLVFLAVVIGVLESRTRENDRDLDCATQRVEVATGNRDSIDSVCEDR